MPKTLTAYSSGSALTSGGFTGPFGQGGVSGGESAAQYSVTTDARFSNLQARVLSGGSGDNTLQFRKNGANANEVCTRTGIGLMGDAVNVDDTVVNDLVNLAYTDTGTDSVVWMAMNIELVGQHGSLYAARVYAVGVICDVASTTRFHHVSGSIVTDGVSTEANAQLLNRAYNLISAIQTSVNSNARINNSIFGARVNGSNVGAAITYGAGITGLQVVTGLGVALASGDLYCMRMTLDTGVEDLALGMVGAEMISSIGASDIWATIGSGSARAASATPNYYVTGGVISSKTTDADARVKLGFAARAAFLRLKLSANTYSTDATLRLFVNGTARLTLTITAGVSAGWHENAVDQFALLETDEISWEIVGGTSGSITIQAIGMTLLPPVGVGLTESPLLERRKLVA